MNTPANTENLSPDRALWADYAVLVVDDEEGLRSFLSRALSARGARVETADSAEAAAVILADSHFDAIVLDIALPGKAGIEWLRELRAGAYAGDVILITAFADMDTAIDALRAGAADFILKPFRVDQILNSLQRCFERARLARENYVLRREVADLSGERGIVGTSQAMRQLYGLIKRVAPTPTTVLIQGESGVGKELAARALHSMSPRAERTFVPVNCAAVSPELIESELFGHVKGAFTGAADSRSGLFVYANGGTLFLDEIGELPLALQTKLLRALEEQRVRPVGSTKEVPVDVRVIAATNRDLQAEVAAGRFREDLYYRLEVLTLTIPPLRERPDDIVPLAEHFNHKLAARIGLPPLDILPEVAARLAGYRWPGNARELRNFIERALILGHFPVDAEADAVGATKDMPLTLAEVEKRHILAVLRQCQGNKTRAAELLEVSRKTLERKCADWGVSL